MATDDENEFFNELFKPSITPVQIDSKLPEQTISDKYQLDVLNDASSCTKLHTKDYIPSALDNLNSDTFLNSTQSSDYTLERMINYRFDKEECQKENSTIGNFSLYFLGFFKSSARLGY